MTKPQIAVLVSGGGTNLQALIDAEKSGIIKSGEIRLVVSNNSEAYALKRAENAKIKTAIILKNGEPERFERDLISLLDFHKIDVIVLAGFMSILSEKFTNHFKDRIINVHPSLIPAYCGKGFYGLRVHEAVLAAGEKITGATVHFVNEIPDGGKIIVQRQVEVKEGDTPEILQKRVMEQAEWIILPEACEMVCKEILQGEGK